MGKLARLQPPCRHNPFGQTIPPMMSRAVLRQRQSRGSSPRVGWSRSRRICTQSRSSCMRLSAPFLTSCIRWELGLNFDVRGSHIKYQAHPPLTKVADCCQIWSMLPADSAVSSKLSVGLVSFCAAHRNCHSIQSPRRREMQPSHGLSGDSTLHNRCTLKRGVGGYRL